MIHVAQQTMRYESVECPACGVDVYMPKHLLDKRRGDKSLSWCYNGHQFSWHESEADRLKKQVEAEQRRVAMALAEAADANKLRREAEEKLARHQKRTRNGVCPCCKRSFTNLRRHMETKHPEAAK